MRRSHIRICISSLSPATMYLCRALGWEWHMVKDSPKRSLNFFSRRTEILCRRQRHAKLRQDSRSVVLTASSPQDHDHLKFQKKMKERPKNEGSNYVKCMINFLTLIRQFLKNSPSYQLLSPLSCGYLPF